MNMMGIDKTLCLIPEPVHIPSADLLKLHDRGPVFVNASAILIYGDHQRLHDILTGLHKGLLPGLHGIKEKKVLGLIIYLIGKGYQIRKYLAALLIIYTIYYLVSGIRYLLRVL